MPEDSEAGRKKVFELVKSIALDNRFTKWCNHQVFKGYQVFNLNDSLQNIQEITSY